MKDLKTLTLEQLLVEAQRLNEQPDHVDTSHELALLSHEITRRQTLSTSDTKREKRPYKATKRTRSNGTQITYIDLEGRRRRVLVDVAPVIGPDGCVELYRSGRLLARVYKSNICHGWKSHTYVTPTNSTPVPTLEDLKVRLPLLDDGALQAEWHVVEYQFHSSKRDLVRKELLRRGHHVG